jgi:hypothetical protein
MNAQVLALGCVFPGEGHPNVTETYPHPTHDFLSGGVSAHAVEPAAPVLRLSQTGDLPTTGSNAKAAALLSAHSRSGATRWASLTGSDAKAAALLSASPFVGASRRLTAFPTFDPLRVQRGRPIRP